MDTKLTDRIFWFAISAAAAYVAVALFAYSIAHPGATQTEVLLDVWRAVTWSW